MFNNNKILILSIVYFSVKRCLFNIVENLQFQLSVSFMLCEAPGLRALPFLSTTAFSLLNMKERQREKRLCAGKKKKKEKEKENCNC